MNNQIPLDNFTNNTQDHIRNLLDFFKRTKEEQDARFAFLKQIEPQSRLAAVLVLLFEQNGRLCVLLTTRGKDLKVHGGQTSLPGGKIDEEDKGDIIATAYREAHEEVNLPRQSSQIHTLGILDLQPFHKLVVTPVVAILTDNAILDHLKHNEGEVDKIFSYPLEGFLDPALSAQTDELVEKGSKDWPYPEDYHHFWDPVIDALGGTSYRYHHFRSSASPITGFTADALIRAAEITFNRSPTYERFAHDQVRNFDEIFTAFEEHRKKEAGKADRQQ
ncbi:hypothetical protein D9613_001434 [Agrocybe pediades]|uniref:Nudix hydrolase domain-containing protein n=1 Tax=Agrocybe pediades TaxID=84607 RepID=A0A8H4R7I1_9AGAR|nr:hypothetical protein D9613_001434 [Agrocybe pediades]